MGSSFRLMDKNIKIVLQRDLKNRSGGLGKYFWGAGKTSYSEKSIAKHWGKRDFGSIVQTRVVGKGEFLRGKVSEGRPDALSMALRSEGQTLDKRI